MKTPGFREAPEGSLRRPVRRWPRRAASEARIRARWTWDKGYAKATRENILIALRRVRNSYGITLHGMPYVRPVVGLTVKTYRGEIGSITEVRKSLVRGGDPEVRIQITPDRCVFLLQTALNGYTLATAPPGGRKLTNTH